MAEYTSAVALVARLIKKKGRSGVQLYRPTPNTASNTSRPWKLDTDVADTLLVSNLHAVFLDAREVRGAQGQFGLEVSFRSRMEMPDSLMLDTTAVAYMIPAELGATKVEVGDLVVSNGHRYSVARSDLLQPGNEPILYELQLKE